MYISKMRLNNFRSFDGEKIVEFSKGINYFVGDNNTGKTTIFKSLEFIQFARSVEGWITKGKEKEQVSVEIELVIQNDNSYIYRDEKSLLELEKRNYRNIKKYHPFFYDNGNGTKRITIKRTSENGNIAKILILDEEKNEFKNISGIDKTINLLFDAQFVWSDLKNEDYQDFGKTKIVGKLINDITQDFQKSETYQDLQKAHQKAFHGDNGLVSVLEGTTQKLSKVMSEQYGETQVKFNFGIPELENFFKTGQILLADNGIETDICEKGTGMQRALALSLIQVYSEISKEGIINNKPIFFFIDEPETFLHPKAQDKLISSLRKISEESQVFITTHSPYLLKQFDNKENQLNVFSRTNERISCSKNLNLLPFSPTWGEINFIAFGVTSVEFHNEMYGFLENNFKKRKEELRDQFDAWTKTQSSTPKFSFENWLISKGLEAGIDYVDDRNNKTKKVTLPVFIRHRIHHPENTKNKEYTFEQLKDSTKMLMNIIKSDI